MHKLYSISSINHCYQTSGSRPVRILCNDLEDYVCKYFTGSSGAAYNLFNEYLSAFFLKIWDLPVPDFALVDIRKDHTEGYNFPYHYFERPCFGSKFMGAFKEVDKVFMGLPKPRFKNESTAINFIMISLFDIWLCNEDRNHNNYNLLFDYSNNLFVPIDHVNVFNGLNIDKQPYLISDSDSLLSSPLFRLFFCGTLKPKTKDFRLSIQKGFENHINNCHVNLSEILASIPSDWRIDIPMVHEKIDYFCSEEWINQCLNFFFDLFNLNYKKTRKL